MRALANQKIFSSFFFCGTVDAKSSSTFTTNSMTTINHIENERTKENFLFFFFHLCIFNGILLPNEWMNHLHMYSLFDFATSRQTSSICCAIENENENRTSAKQITEWNEPNRKSFLSALGRLVRSLSTFVNTSNTFNAIFDVNRFGKNPIRRDASFNS